MQGAKASLRSCRLTTAAKSLSNQRCDAGIPLGPGADAALCADKVAVLHIAHALRTIARDEGMFGLYRGLGATLLQVTPSLAINYTAYGTLRSHWLELYGQESSTVSLLETGASCRGSGARAGTS